MDLVQSSLPFIFVLLSGYILKYSCDAFESSAGYLSRNMSSGIKGATINAVGSSMPELFTVVATLFFFDDPQMFAIGLGVTAGSAIFNGCVIPAFSILLARDEKGQKVRAIVLDKPSLIRDIFWVLLAEVALVLMLGQSQLTLWMAVLLNLIYVGYAYHIYRHARASGEDEIEAYEEAQMPDYGVIGNIFTFNVNGLLFGNRGYSTFRALTVLSTCIVIISGASHLLVVGVMGVSDVVGIPAFVSGLVLGAAASSIPDLILSIKDATFLVMFLYLNNRAEATATVTQMIDQRKNTSSSPCSRGIPDSPFHINQTTNGSAIEIVVSNVLLANGLETAS